MDLAALRKDVFESAMPDGQALNHESAMQSSGDSRASYLKNVSLEANCGKLIDQLGTQFPEHKPSAVQQTQATHCRNVNDSLEEWKEKVNVSVDIQAGNTKTQDKVDDENADKYDFFFF
ncbi:hypothetical protein QYF36_011644 [Acer negundo]|nr:hypothetical protein QYF36_011644 [Acer negundo]